LVDLKILAMSDIYIGTSGWQYNHWWGNFYPKDLKKDDWLSYYSGEFNSVEVNTSFYGAIKKKTYKKWLSEVPDDFCFSIKANRYITHMKRLKDADKTVPIFFSNLGAFKGIEDTVILWQLRPDMKMHKERFLVLLGILEREGRGFKHAFEFRHKEWVSKETFEMFSKTNLAWSVVFQDWSKWPMLKDYEILFGGDALADKLKFIYVRFHGREQLYSSSYSNEELAKWAKKMQKWIDKGLTVYAYFNNDALGYAPGNALTLKQML
jgi:uncharacterized protein YecE (DUF72 family)